MADAIIWNDNPGPVTGSTVFGYFDNSILFQGDAIRASKWAARRLGFPSVDVEMDSGSFYACYEESILEYSAQVQQFTIRENMSSLMGTSNDSSNPSYVNYSNKLVTTNLSRIITISENYGTEIGIGGNITWHKASIYISKSIQDYDLDILVASASAGGNAIEIKRIYHNEPIAFGYGLAGVYNSTGVIGSAEPAGTYSTLGDFGWQGLAPGGISTGLSYTLMPVYEDLLRMQAIEFNYQLRRSGYSFEVRNNKLRIFPIPNSDQILWIEFIYKKDKIYGTENNLTGSSYYGGSDSSITTNIGDAPYTVMNYDVINGPGKRWILKYFLACCKQTLGEIRSKYQTIPIPNSEIYLNGEALKQEGQSEKEQLITLLREDLERTSIHTQMQLQSESAKNLQDTLTKIPMYIYIG